MNLESFYKIEPYGLDKLQKEELFFKEIKLLTEHHYNSCYEYKKILDKLNIDIDKIYETENIPYIPVRLFKEFELKSISEKDIFKIMTSSGTTGQTVSKIYLSKENALNQTKTLIHIISSFIGKRRLPLLLLDTEMIKKDRSMFSARGAGIIGFSSFGRNTIYALDENMEIDIDKVTSFLREHENDTILMFGYTYMIWQFIIKKLEQQNKCFNIKNGILFHIGGWKKLKAEAVDSVAYNKHIQGVLGNIKVHNYYGMAEQLGSVFVECEYGHMHCSNYSNIIIRNPKDFTSCINGQKGLIQLLSVLPSSYPGHSILTEDEGFILGEDDCPCGRKGKYFKILGRIKNAEIRGCSDTYEKH